MPRPRGTTLPNALAVLCQQAARKYGYGPERTRPGGVTQLAEDLALQRPHVSTAINQPGKRRLSRDVAAEMVARLAEVQTRRRDFTAEFDALASVCPETRTLLEDGRGILALVRSHRPITPTHTQREIAGDFVPRPGLPTVNAT